MIAGPSTSSQAADEAVDDPNWTNNDKDKSDTESEPDDDFLPEPPKKKRRRTKKLSKAEKLAKCPHCLREFTNLKHHINQQHAQVYPLFLSCVRVKFLFSNLTQRGTKSNKSGGSFIHQRVEFFKLLSYFG